MIKFKHAALLTVVTAALCLTYLAAKAAEPGSEQDPLVSKSYVDSLIEEVLKQTGGGASVFAPVNLQPGQIIIGEEGTEIILRSGSGTAYHTGADGLVNVTDGTELFIGAPVPKNNLIIVPRADGRGVMVSVNSWLIVKGGYYVTN